MVPRKNISLRYVVKLIGLLSVAALCVAALGAGSASAAALCSEEPEEVGEELVCKEGTQLSVVEIEAENEGSVEIETSVGEISCSSSAFSGEALSLSEKVNGELSSFTFSECVDAVPSCTLEGMFAYTPFNFAVIAVRNVAPEGLFEIFKPKTEAKFDCGFLGKISCTYGSNVGETMLGDAYNATQQVKVNALLKKSAGGGLCPAEITVKATFNIWRVVGGMKKQLYVAKQ